MADKENRGPLPPYIPFKTFLTFIQKLKSTAVPERIDLSVLRTYSGSTARQLIAALKFLGLIEDAGTTNEQLTKLVNAYDSPGWKDELSDLIFTKYSDIIGNLNIDIATPAQVDEKFKAKGADGQVLQKCVGFYVAALVNAGVSFSPYIMNRPRAKADRGRVKIKRRENGNGMQDPGEEPPSSGMVRFAFPIPGKQSANIYVPAEITEDDWNMIDAMVAAYIQRKEKTIK
jgi:hypothetical protein